MWDIHARLRGLVVLAVATLLWGCSSDSHPTATADLPLGWDEAEPITDLVQVECATSDMDFSGETAVFEPGSGMVAVSYDKAHFRCEQAVEGYFKVESDTLDILVQPVDMHPTTVVRCDCAYGITFTIKPLAAGDVQTTLFRRWDDLNIPNDPVEIVSSLVTIQ